MKKPIAPVCLFYLAAFAPNLSLAGQGGGSTLAGLVGAYYANADLSGTPVFIRRDVRVDFDWGSLLAPGGSIAEPYASFPKDNFSVRWEGQVIPAFGETYTFRVFADDGARLYLKPAGSGTWDTLIDAWSGASGTWSEAAVTLVAGTAYDLRLEYRELTGAAAIRLYWAAPSFSEEVIDPLAEVGSNVTHWEQVFADIVKGARNSWSSYNGQTPGTDADGWPDSDFLYYFQESLNMGLGLDPLMRGTIAFRFNGRGTVSIGGNVESGSLNDSYDPVTNTTSGTFTTVDNNANASSFRVANSDRDGDYGTDGQPDRDGVTGLQLMLPTAPDASSSYPFDALFLPQIREAYEHFTILRSNLNNGNQERFWSDRTTPAFFNQSRGRPLDRVYSNPDYGLKNNGASWEHKILLCNETGRDLFINIPHMADGWDPSDTSGYVNKLARLIKYGSDGLEPYTSLQADPVYPPLNPNLRVYIELSNEVWNFGGDAFRQYWDIDAMTTADADAFLVGGVTDPLARPQDFPILNYDNLSTAKDGNGNYVSLGTWRFRKVMLRTIQISDIFRGIFGHDAMHARIRPMYEWQYANTNDTAGKGLKFAEEYFNNADGQSHVATPYPVNHYLWGGGGATYYGSSNGWAVTDILADPGFEAPALPIGYNEAPAHPEWSFFGAAGIAVDGGESDDIPPPWDGGQMAFIAGTGQISVDVTFPSDFRSDVFAVGFKALNRVKNGTTESDAHKVQVFFDGVPINARSYNQSNGYVPLTYDPDTPWIARVVFWTDSEYYSTETFGIVAGSTHTITFTGIGDPDDALFLEDVRITHVDAIFDGDMPAGGSAAGQVNSSTYLTGLNVQNDWATAYGLHHITYEGGWSLGGDTGGSPIQNRAKFGSAEASEVNERALDYFQRAGGAVNTLGTYAQWPSWSDNYAVEGLLDLVNNPLLQGQRAFLSKLPVASTNGTGVPNRLLISDARLGMGTSLTGATATLDTAGDWISWHLLVPQRGDYTLTIAASGDADFVVEINGTVARTFAGAASLTPIVADLMTGQNGLRIRCLGGGSLTVSDILVENPDFTSAPAFSPRGGSFEYPVTISISSESPGAEIRYTLDGSEPSPTHGIVYTSPFLVSTDTEVRAIATAAGLNPSVTVSEFYQPAGGGAFFAVWDFAGDGGQGSVAPEFKTVADPSILAVTGPGLSPSSYLGDAFSATQATATTLQGAIDADDYFSIFLNGEGEPYSLSAIEFNPFSQNNERTFTVFSTVHGFTAADAIGSLNYKGNFGSAEAFHFDLTGHDNLTGPVELRVYVHGLDNQYESVGIGNHTGLDFIVYGSVGSGQSPAETWAAGYGLAFLPDDDSDRDGLAMLLEYALDADPTSADIPDPAPGASINGHSFTFPRYTGRTDITYTVQTSSDLQTWSDAARSIDGAATVPLSGDFTVDTSGTSPVSTTVTHQAPTNPIFWRLFVGQ
ncbi:MAG: PA14 domain-containing protein [Oceanipulchritudo sp.]